MHTIVVVWAFLKAGWYWEAPVLMLIVNDLINGLTAYPKIETFLSVARDCLSWHQHADSPGTFKKLFRRSNPPVGRLQAATPPSPIRAAAWLPFLLIAASFVGGCAFGTCLLGKLPVALESLLTEAAVILASPNDINWQEDLGALAKANAPGVLDCVVKAVTVSAQTKITAFRGEPSTTLRLQAERGQIWLNSHPSACNPTTLRMFADRSKEPTPPYIGRLWAELLALDSGGMK